MASLLLNKIYVGKICVLLFPDYPSAAAQSAFGGSVLKPQSRDLSTASEAEYYGKVRKRFSNATHTT